MNAHHSDFWPSMTPATDVSEHRFIHVVGSGVWSHSEVADPGWPVQYLGTLTLPNATKVAYWGVDVPDGADPSDGAHVDLRALYARVSETEWMVAGRAVQLVEWSRTHRHCGRCGARTAPAANERALKCVSCSLMAFPRLAPAVITLVTRGSGADEEALLARGVMWQIPMYSCLAGFVEPGENLEQAVAREILEEVGVRVKDVRYVASQPWPFPHSIMLGFRATFADGDIVCDPSEILDAQWYKRDSLPMIPPAMSIARRLIDQWVFEAD